MPHDAAARGPLGESLARLFLESRGYTIRGRNLRCGRHELDLVAERGRTLIAIEVKWRRVRPGAEPDAAAEAWRRGQRERAAGVVLALMERWPDAAERPWRFDLVTIEERPDGLTLTHRPGAWSPGGSFW